jgi:hypothetical protein
MNFIVAGKFELWGSNGTCSKDVGLDLKVEKTKYMLMYRSQ